MDTNLCDECGKSTSFGSGRFVNRLATDNGWLCPHCQEEECDYCHEMVIDFGGSAEGSIICDECKEKGADLCNN